MAKPIPTAPQIAAMEADILNKTTQQTAFTDTAALQDTVIANKLLIDTAFKDLFNYYNDDIITHYDSERKAINGSFITSPIVEADITGVGGNPPSGRLVPTAPATDIVRIDEFDTAAYTDLDTDNELQNILDQAVPEDQLANGVSGTTPTVTATSLTNSALTASSITLDMIDAVGPMSFSIGDVFVVHDGGTDAAVVEVTGVTDNIGGDPPFDFTLDIIVKIAPTGTIAASSNVIDSFTGFTDSERDTKTATDTDLQPIMDELIVLLEAELNARIANIAAQLAALALNDDPDGVAQITTATTNANTADTFIDAYLISTDISDTGLASLATERGTRTTELNGRIVEILANYTGQTEDYYELRFSTANDRGNTQRGTLREQSNAASVKSDMLALAASLQGSIDALNAIIP